MRDYLITEIGEDKFKHQMIVGFFIVDFILLDKLVVLEVDGPSHAKSKYYDARRTAFLEEAGFQVMRATNRAVNRDVAKALSDVLAMPSVSNSTKRLRSALAKANALKGAAMAGNNRTTA